MEAIYTVKVDTKQADSEVKKFDKTLDQLVDEVRELDKATDQFSTDKLEDSLEDLNKLVESGTLNFEDYSKVIEQYTDIALKAGQASPISKQAIESAAALKQEYQTVETQIDALAQKGSNLSAALQLAEGVTAGYQAFIGITALVGDENEELVEVLTKLQAVQGVAQSIQTLRNALDKESILLVKAKALGEKIFGNALKTNLVTTKASSLASKGQAVATSGAAAAQTALNVAMNANPIFLLITAIVALVAAVVVFIATSNDAADQQERLNDQIENTTRAMERQALATDSRVARMQKEIETTNKLLDADIKLLQSIKNRTAAQETELKKKLAERQANEVDKYNIAIDAAVEKSDFFAKQVRRSFDAIDNAIEATDIEDGINNIDYSKVSARTNEFKNQLLDILNSDIDNGEKVKQLEDLEANFVAVSRKLAFWNRQLDEGETEYFAEVVSGFEGVGDILDNARRSLSNINELQQDRDTFQAVEERKKQQQELADLERRRAEAARRRQQRLAEEAREAKRIQDLLISYERQTQDIRTSLIEDSFEREFEALTIKFEREINAIEGNSEQANALRLALFDQFVAAENEINQRRANQLAAQEQELLEKIDAIRNSLVLDDGAQQLEDLRLQQEAELEILRQGLEQELITQQEFDLLMLEQKAQFEALLTQIEKDEAEKRKQEAEKERDRKIQLFKDYTSAAGDLINGLSALNELSTQIQLANAEGNEAKQESIRKKSFERSKKLQIAQATIAGIQGVINALTASSTIPEPFGTILKAVNAASVGISTAANIAKIRNTKFQGGGGGSASIPTAAGAGGLGGLGATAGQAAGSSDLSDIQTILDDTNTAQDAGSGATIGVLESDITGTQVVVQESADKATFG